MESYLLLENGELPEIEVVHFLSRKLGSTHPLDIAIMSNDNLAIFAQVHVALHQIQPTAHCVLKGSSCVFWVFAASTAMSSVQLPASGTFAECTLSDFAWPF